MQLAYRIILPPRKSTHNPSAINFAARTFLRRTLLGDDCSVTRASSDHESGLYRAGRPESVRRAELQGKYVERLSPEDS